LIAEHDAGPPFRSAGCYWPGWTVPRRRSGPATAVENGRSEDFIVLPRWATSVKHFFPANKYGFQRNRRGRPRTRSRGRPAALRTIHAEKMLRSVTGRGGQRMCKYHSFAVAGNTVRWATYPQPPHDPNPIAIDSPLLRSIDFNPLPKSICCELPRSTYFRPNNL